MKEQVISFKLAKLAKEKGFINSLANGFYDNTGKIEKLNYYETSEDLTSYMKFYDKENKVLSSYHIDKAVRYEDNYYLISTQSLLQKWLREVHDIVVYVTPFVHDTTEETDGTYSYFVYQKDKWIKDGVDFDLFEEALEKGLLKALKLIKDEKI